ncbi:hypothetical protein KV102_15315 [Mumia sp. zg.B53]|uniref:hypothetical protein n=1 Tax=unclassified Mumia TaxID=2621872 RepID=UPI001C6F1C73|nr:MULTISPECIES: hypothetical protein [unclassified Mumia]MBW9205753.1 hypothetical protein [Mumia sp. zg.B17]MBW9216208.1 hypothetical protein [Mumia sp. zg.B53]
MAVTTAGVVDRGLRRTGDPRVWGTTIGAAGASVFVHANRGELPSTASIVAVVLWVGALAAYVWAVFVRPRWFPEPEPVRGSAPWIYLASVVGMLALVQVGQMALDAGDKVDVLPAVIVLAVGLHFLPFARAFHTPMFIRLGLAMAALGVVGLVLGLAWTETAAPAIAVLAGLVMLLVITEAALRDDGHAPF